MRRILTNATVTTTALSLTAAADAPRDVWINMRSDVVSNDRGESAGTAVEWTFDVQCSK